MFSPSAKCNDRTCHVASQRCRPKRRERGKELTTPIETLEIERSEMESSSLFPFDVMSHITTVLMDTFRGCTVIDVDDNGEY